MTALYDIVFLQPEDFAARRAVFDALVADGVARAVFYDCTAPTFATFESVAGPGVGWCIPAYDRSGFAAVGWLNGFTGRAAMAHFCFTRRAAPQAVAIGLQWCHTVFATGRFDCLIGLTPAPYRHALACISQIGFEFSPLRIPGACFMARRNRYVDGVFSRLTEVRT